MFNTYIPSKETKKYNSVNRGDLFGTVVRSRNVDFNKKGYLSLARKPMTLYTEVEDSDFGTPIVITSDDSVIYVITNERAFTIDSSGQSATERNGGTVPNFGFQSDAVFFTTDLHASGSQTIGSLNGSTWTERITGLSSSYPHPLCISEHQGYLAVGNGNTVRLYNASYSLQTTCTLPAAQIVTWIRWRANLLYIGCRNINGGEAKMYIWNGSGTAAQNGYGVGCEWTLSGCEYGSTIAIVTALGQLLQFAGDGFIPITTEDGIEANLPIYYNPNVPWGSSASVSNLVGKVASRGMAARGKKIYLNVEGTINFQTGGTPRELLEMPSGLWIFDPSIGLYHKGGYDHKRWASKSITAALSNVLTISTAAVYETGDPVVLTSVGFLTGDPQINQIYYAIKVDSTHLKLANTPQQALASVNITIDDQATPAANLAFNSYQSVGATRISTPGGLCLVTTLGMPRFFGSEVIYGGDADLAAGGTPTGVVMSLGMGKNIGSFTTPKIQAEYVTDLFKKILAKFPPLNIPTRKIIVKYRTSNRWGIPGRRDFGNTGATWVNSTSFTVNPKNYDMYSAQDGDEIEFISGGASGYTAHISSIVVNSSSQWTITIDEAMPDVSASDTSDFFIEDFIKYKTISTTADAAAAAKGFKNMALAQNAKWVQLKIELRGYTDIEETIDMEEIAVVSGADQKYA